MSPTGTITLGTGLNTITLTGNTGAITCVDITGDTLTLNGGIYAGDTITTNRGIYSIGTITVVGSSGGIIVQGNGGVNIDGSIIAGGGAITGKGIRSYGVIYADGAIVGGETAFFNTSMSSTAALCNTINAYTGTQITTKSIINFNNASNVLYGFIDPLTTNGPRVRFYGTSNQYIYYNTANEFGNFDATSSSTKWKIDATGIINCASLLSNSIGPPSGEKTININATKNFNLLKANGSSRIQMFPETDETYGLDIIMVHATASNVGDGYWYWNKNGLCGFYKGGTSKWVADTNGDIACNKITATFTAFSDMRIKTNIIDINDTSALAIIRQIQPKIYNYIDTKTRGNNPVWGFIAQQVKSVLEYSTDIITNFIPDVYELAEVLGTNTIKLNTKTTVNFEVNKKIRLIKINGDYLETNITSILDDYTFTVEENITQQQIFVYGREVDDFHTLNKDAIFTVATAALQEVDKELQETVKELQSEKNLRQLLETKLLDLETRFLNLENRIKDLEKR